MSEFMTLHIHRKGALYCADCAKCGTTIYTHEWTSNNFNEERDAMEAGALRCPECNGTTDAETFHKCRDSYAGRYSANGYLDCTDWSYDTNRRRLGRHLRDMYGDA